MKLDNIVLILVGIGLFGMVLYISINDESSTKTTNQQILTEDQRAIMIELNIICSTNHNHPLLQGKEICAYIPNLKEKLKQ